MKRLVLIILLSLLWASPVEAVVSWESYSDSNRTVVSNNFTASGSWVYLKGIGLQKNKDYQAKVYDADPNNYPLSPVLTHVGQSDNNGVFLSQVQPSAYPSSVAGTWKAELWKIQPLTLEVTDTFTVQASAIPEIPSVFAAVAIVFICVLVWWLMRRRRKWHTPIFG